MKKIILFLSLSVLLMSCVEDNTTSPAKADGVFYGNLSVGDFTEQAGITLTENADSTVNILFDDVKFAENMPLRIDIALKGVPALKADGVLRFSAVDIDPYTNNEQEPQPDYRFATISGVVEGDELLLEARMSDELSPYVAGKVFSFSGHKE
ncbi:MAG: hypothetical protein IKW46_01265 [Bacteroidaceae bacterium]|nr:hypothetical protein [Bacteroidaceae bacterium]